MESRPTINFEPNIPVVVGLRWTDGKLCKGLYGDRVMFSTTDDRVMFLDADVAYQIRQMDLAAGELITICKEKKAAKGPVYWKITRAAAPRPTVAPDPAPVAAAPAKRPAYAKPTIPARCYADNTTEQLEASLANLAEGKHPATPRPTPVPPAIAAKLDSHPPVNGNGLPPMKATYSHAMAEFLLMAGRATRDAERILGTEGAAVKFDSRDVAALATTAFIQAAREGWINWKPGDVA